MTQCKCHTLKGDRCKKAAKENSKFCNIHQKCKNVAPVKAKPPKVKPPKVKPKAVKGKTIKVKIVKPKGACDSHKVVDLRKMAKQAKIKNYSKMKKAELCKALKITDKKVTPKKITPKKATPPKRNTPKVSPNRIDLKKIPNIYDIINLEEISAEDYLGDDKNNIIILYKNQAQGFNKDDLVKSIIDGNDMFYQCGKAHLLRVAEKDIVGEPMILLRGTSNYFIALQNLKDVLKSKKRVFDLVEFEKMKYIVHIDSIDHGDMLNWKGVQIEAESSWHCQEGTDAMLYALI